MDQRWSRLSYHMVPSLGAFIQVWTCTQVQAPFGHELDVTTVRDTNSVPDLTAGAFFSGEQSCWFLRFTSGSSPFSCVPHLGGLLSHWGFRGGSRGAPGELQVGGSMGSSEVLLLDPPGPYLEPTDPQQPPSSHSQHIQTPRSANCQSSRPCSQATSHLAVPGHHIEKEIR